MWLSPAALCVRVMEPSPPLLELMNGRRRSLFSPPFDVICPFSLAPRGGRSYVYCQPLPHPKKELSLGSLTWVCSQWAAWRHAFPRLKWFFLKSADDFFPRKGGGNSSFSSFYQMAIHFPHSSSSGGIKIFREEGKSFFRRVCLRVIAPLQKLISFKLIHQSTAARLPPFPHESFFPEMVWGNESLSSSSPFLPLPLPSPVIK